MHHNIFIVQAIDQHLLFVNLLFCNLQKHDLKEGWKTNYWVRVWN